MIEEAADDYDWRREVLLLTSQLELLKWEETKAQLLVKTSELKDEIKICSSHLKEVAKKVKAKFFEDIMKHINPSRIWDIVEWTKLCRQVANIILTDGQSQVASDPDKVTKIL